MSKKLRVLHYPQAHCEAFTIEVNTFEEAKKVSSLLASYDFFQYKNRIKSGYSNMTILEEFDEEKREWVACVGEETKVGDTDERDCYFNYDFAL